MANVAAEPDTKRPKMAETRGTSVSWAGAQAQECRVLCEYVSHPQTPAADGRPSMAEMQSIAELIRTKAGIVPEYGVICGSGLGGLANVVCNAVAMDYTDIPGFPVSTGWFVFVQPFWGAGKRAGKRNYADQ